MEILLLLLLLAVFLLPSFFMMRTQRKRQAEIQNLQNSLNVGDRVVTASGFHGTITAIRETEVDLELSPGVEATMEKMGVVRHAIPAGQFPGATGQPGAMQPGSSAGDYQIHPENRPRPEQSDEFGGVENPGDRDDRPGNTGPGQPGDPR